jgi:peroxiredoxin Q/BCP
MAATGSKAKAYPSVGAKAPSFSCPGSNGKTVKLSDFKGKKAVVLYFYPRDNTPGCTKEACEFSDRHAKLKKAGAEVLGVSPDSLESHGKFTDKYDLLITLLSDRDHKLCQAYGVWQKKKMAGREYMGVVRTTFVIDKQGKIAHVFEKVKAAGHAEEVLGWIKSNL